MIKLNEYEEHLKDKKELVYHWLYTKEITYGSEWYDNLVNKTLGSDKE